MEKGKSVALRVKEYMETDAGAKKKVGDAVSKLSRLIARKRKMDEESPTLVYEDRIWLGNYLQATNKEFLINNGITTVVSCIDQETYLTLPEVSYHRFPTKGMSFAIEMALTLGSKPSWISFMSWWPDPKGLCWCIGILCGT